MQPIKIHATFQIIKANESESQMNRYFWLLNREWIESQKNESCSTLLPAWSFGAEIYLRTAVL